MSIVDSDVIVVGAGVGGLASALLLARVGASVTLVEKHDVHEPAGAGILLQPNGLAVLCGLGLGDQLRRTGHAIRTTLVHGTRGRPVTALTTPDFGNGLDHVLAIRRSALHHALLEAVAAQPMITVRSGGHVVAAAGTGSIELDWESRRTTLTGDLVVGADGVNSTVRGCAEFGATVTRTPHRYLRGLVPWDSSVSELEGEFWTPLGLFGGARVDTSTTYFYASATAPGVARAVDAADLSGLRQVWTEHLGIAGRVLERVSAMGDLLVNDVVRVDCRRWHDGRVVLVGDAAHAMAPTMGQGANSALVDAAVLAEELSRDTPVRSSLERYAARRRRAVGRVQDRADTLTRLAHLTSPLGRRTRDVTLRTLGRLPGTGQRLVRAAQQEDPAELFRTVRALSPTSTAG